MSNMPPIRRSALRPPPTSRQGLRESSHLVPIANSWLKIAGKAFWKGMKKLFGIALYIPGKFVRMNAPGNKQDGSLKK